MKGIKSNAVRRVLGVYVRVPLERHKWSIIWLLYPFSGSWTSLSFISYGGTEANLEQLSDFCQGPEACYRRRKGEPGLVSLDRMFTPCSLAPLRPESGILHTQEKQTFICWGSLLLWVSDRAGGLVTYNLTTCVLVTWDHRLQVVLCIKERGWHITPCPREWQNHVLTSLLNPVWQKRHSDNEGVIYI